jgi:murein DD-endopeptidase MepM/ murein hydrolase activator NlpD
MEYYEKTGGAVAKLSWQQVGAPLPSTGTGTNILVSGWEDGESEGFRDRVEYSNNVAGYFNSSTPPPECHRWFLNTAHTGSRVLRIAGYSQATYAYCYYRVFDVDIPVKSGLKLSYWIYHAVGTPRVSVDGHFTDGSVIRDFKNSDYLKDQYNIRIHPSARQDPMRAWYYVEVDLSPAAGKTLDYIMFAFDNGGNGFTGQYETYVDDFRIFYNNVVSLTDGNPKGIFGSGAQTDEVTEPNNWRWSEWFYGHQGIDRIAWMYDSCGGNYNYVIGGHQNDLVEYLMKFGGQYSRLVLRGMASRPGPVEMEIYVDGQYRGKTAWDADNGCNQDVAVEIKGIPYGTHAIAVKFVNDYSPGGGIDRNFFLDGLYVAPTASPSIGWAYPVGSADSASGWEVTTILGESFYLPSTGKWYRGHLGEDWAKSGGGSLGQPVYTAAAGKVVIAIPNCGNYLNVVVIEHNVAGFVEPIYSFYGHIESEGFVKEGDWVEKSQQIGTIGNPSPYNPHLHFEIKNRTALINPPFSPCTDTSGRYISAGYSGISNDYLDSNDYYDPSDTVNANRFYHPRRFIEGHK